MQKKEIGWFSQSLESDSPQNCEIDIKRASTLPSLTIWKRLSFIIIITRNTIALARIDFRYLSKQENYKYICHSVKFALNIDFPGRLHRNCIGISYKSRPRI